MTRSASAQRPLCATAQSSACRAGILPQSDPDSSGHFFQHRTQRSFQQEVFSRGFQHPEVFSTQSFSV